MPASSDSLPISDRPAGSLPWTITVVGVLAGGLVSLLLGVVAWVGQGMVERLDALQGSVHRLEVRLERQEGLASQLADHEARIRALERAPR